VDATALIAIDWGTTSARAYRQNASGRIVGERSAHLGIAQIRDGKFAAALSTLLDDWAQDAAPRLACGMIGSRQGWIEAPYRECPAALDALAAGLTEVNDGRLTIVPGVTCVDGAGVPDVMRGEETQILGATLGVGTPDASPRLVVLPGTHSKWAIVGDGRIEAFSTYLTGELFSVLKEHSVLGRMMAATTAPRAQAMQAFTRGVERGVAAKGQPASLLHDVFGARTLALFRELPEATTADYLSGLLIGSEIREGAAWAAGRGVRAERVVLVGAPALVERYTAACALAGIVAAPGPADAAARGLWWIAKHAGIVQ
jgi:2-dehydro-3-deoxygalactonokinase